MKKAEAVQKEKVGSVDTLVTMAERRIIPVPRDPLDDFFDDEAMDHSPKVTVE